MASLARLRVTWSGGGVIGGGLSTFYALDTSVAGIPAAVLAFFNVNPLSFPAGLTITVPNSGDTIDDATGDLVGSWSTGSGGGTVTGTDTGPFAAGVGLRVKWTTAGIVARRRVVGSTFVCPIPAGAYQNDGTLASAVVTDFNSRCAALVASTPDFVVWSRPTASRAGSSHLITSGTCPDKVSWLRSRRT